MAPAPDIPEKDLGPEGEVHAKYEFLRGLGALSPEVAFAKVQGSFDRGLIFEILSAPQAHGLDSFDYQQEAR